MGRNGTINGEVHAKKLIIQGSVEGSAEAERIEIHADGRMTGKVTSSELVIEAQAVFEGESHFKERPQQSGKKITKKVKEPEIKAEASNNEPTPASA